jgi:hypothetical protein
VDDFNRRKAHEIVSTIRMMTPAAPPPAAPAA